MKSRQTLRIIAFLVALLLTAAGCSSPESEIRRMLAELVREGTIAEQEHPLARIGHARKIASHFAEKLEASFEEGEHEGFTSGSRKELEEKLAAGFTQFNRLELELKIQKVAVSGQTATVTGEASALGSMPGADGKFLERHLIEIHLDYGSGQWLIVSVRSLKNLRE